MSGERPVVESPPPAPPGPGSPVVLPRWVVGLLAGGCVVLLAICAFLLGRVTTPVQRAEVPEPAAVAEEAADEVEEIAPDEPHEEPAPPAPWWPPEEGARPAAEPPGAGAAREERAEAVPVRDERAVADYFARMEAAAGPARTGQEPRALARALLDQALSGNPKGIEELIASQRALVARLGEVAPPPACQEHHERSVRLVVRGISLLERARDAIAGAGALDAAYLATEGREIEQEARAVDALASDLRGGVGLQSP
jgi:hypothetical protein